MRLVKIAASDNGAHENQTTNAKIPVPAGWAVIPDGMELLNFPFGELTAEEIDGVMTVTGWKPGVKPEPAPAPDPEPSAEELLDILLGGADSE